MGENAVYTFMNHHNERNHLVGFWKA